MMMQEGTNSLRKLRRDWWKTKLCTACVSPLGRFLSRGGICPQCGLRVCKNCRSEFQSGTWVCVLCSGGMPSDDLAKTTKSLGRDSRSIRRSWTISNPQRAQTNSPILKSYTVLYPEEGEGTDGSPDGTHEGECSASTSHLSNIEEDATGKPKLFFGGSDQGINNTTHKGVHISRHGGIHQKKNGAGHSGTNNDEAVNGLSTTRQFHSLPRMSGSSGGLSIFAPSFSTSPSATARVLGLANKIGKRSFTSDFDKENIKRHRSFQSTLHPYNPSQVNPPSPATSVNFIEETFWDYYDYEIENSSDPSSTPRNLRRPVPESSAAPTNRPPPAKTHPENRRRGEGPKSSTLVAIRTDSNRSSCERSLGETMDYDCSLKMNHYSSLSDTEINETGKYEEKEKKAAHLYSTGGTTHRRHSNIETNPGSRAQYHYATISSSTNPYLPASEYVYRRRHDEMLNEAPPKPERKFRNSKRSASLNAYDGRKLFSPLRTYCVLMKENIEPGVSVALERNSSTETTSANLFTSPSAVGCSSGHDHHIRNKSKFKMESSSSPINSTTASSAIRNNSSPISLSFASSTPLKFNSLPRERYIRIERESGDGSVNTEKFSSLRHPARKSEILLGKSSLEYKQRQQQQISANPSEIGNANREKKNVTRVPIVKDDNDQHFSPIRNFSFTTTAPSKNKIERSQSYKEISSSRPYPHYHQYHPQQFRETAGDSRANNTASASNIHSSHHQLSGVNHADKSSATADLNFVTAGTKGLPTFRNGGRNPPPSSLTTWNTRDKHDSRGGGGGGDDGNTCHTNASGSRDFFRSDFDDGSDVVIENFIKIHSSNTLPRRKYPPSTTQISAAPQNDNEHIYKESGNSIMKPAYIKGAASRLQQDSSDSYLRQCSTFPRGASQRNKKCDGMDGTANQPEHLPNYKTQDNPKGYPNVEKLDIFFQPTSSPSSLSPQSNVPKQHSSQTMSKGASSERILPIRMVPQTGPGSSATLPHPYIRRNKQMSIAPPTEKPSSPVSMMDKSSKSTESTGPSISEVEMEIERDIYYQKTRSLDRVRPPSKSKLKSVLSIGRSTAGDTNTSRHPHYPMEIDYSDSQPYKSNNARQQQQHHHHETMFSIDQLDTSYANGRNASSGKSIHVTSDPLEPQQIVHHSTPLAPIPSPRLKRKAKQAQQDTTTFLSEKGSSVNATLCSPKINGDEMSSGNGSKLIGPGTNYGSKKLLSSSPTTVSARKANEPDHSDQQSRGISSATQRNELDPSRKTNVPPTKSSSNPISLGNPSLNASSGSSSLPASSVLSLTKETSIKTNPHQFHHSQMTLNGMSGGVDGTVKSETSSGTNHISQPSTTPVTPNYSNSDSPGVNFMISNSATAPGFALNNSKLAAAILQSELQHQQASASSSTNKYLSEVGNRTKGVAMHTPEHIAAATSYASSQQNKKSALATADTSKVGGGSGNFHKAVRFEPHVIAMEIESEQRKLQQQLSGASAAPNSPSSSPVNNVGISPGSSVVSSPAGIMKPNSGNHMQRHGSSSASKARQQHYVHASSYLPVLYHSYHQQQHKYIRKGANTSSIAGGSTGKGGKKSKKYKGFVARAIAKVKSKAVAASNLNRKQGDSIPTVYYPVGKEATKGTFMQYYNSSNPTNTSPSSSVITYISPQPQTQHQQPPVQQSLEESSAHQDQYNIQQQKGVASSVPSITVSLSSESSTVPISSSSEKNTASDGQKRGSGNKISATPTKILTESPGLLEGKKGSRQLGDGSVKFTSSGRLRKNLHKNQKGSSSPLASSSSTSSLPLKSSGPSRMDGYLQSLGGDEGSFPSSNDNLNDDNDPQGMQIPNSFLLESDQLTPSSTSSSSSSSFTSNLQESYELFHNQTLPDRVHQQVTATTTQLMHVAENEDKEMKLHSLAHDDEDSDNANDDCEDDDNDDVPFAFKSFDESDFGEEEDGEADFVFYPAPRGSTKPSGITSSSSSAKHLIDTDRKKAITTTSALTSSTDVASHAPFGSGNETTTKGANNIAPAQYSDSAVDNTSRKGSSTSSTSSEPKMVIGIPTYRSPNKPTRLISSHHGKSQASIPNANPTIISSTSPSKENVKQSSSSFSSSAVFKQPHPQQQSQECTPQSKPNAVISEGDNSTSIQASFGSMHKDSSREERSLKSTPSEDTTHHIPPHESKGLLLSSPPQHRNQPGKVRQQHHKNENQVDVVVVEELQKSQQHSHAFFAPTNQGTNNTTTAARHNENEAITSSVALRGRGPEHERIDHDDDDEDTCLQKKDVQRNVVAAPRVTTNSVDVAESRRNERVSTCAVRTSIPPDAKDALKIATSEEQGIIASVTTSRNSTGPLCNSTVHENPLKKNEGRLTDLTSSTISSSGHHHHHHLQLARREKKVEERSEHQRDDDDEEEGLRYGASTNVKHPKDPPNITRSINESSTSSGGGAPEANKVLSLKNNNNSNSSLQFEEDEEQARTSWTSNSKKPSIPIPCTKRKTHNTVTNNHHSNTKDAERLKRLEVVKRQQKISTTATTATDFKNNIAAILDNPPCGSNNDDVFARETQSPTASSNSSEQPNSLETECANDQSFLSESEVQSCGKSPSPSPRVRGRKNKGHGGARLLPKFQTGKYSGGEGGHNSEEEEDSSHLLNVEHARSLEKQSKSLPAESLQSNSSRDQKDRSSPLIFPDSGPVGMSILPPQHPAAASTSASETTNYNGKFKSRVLLNSDDLEDDDELSNAVAEAVSSGANQVVSSSPRVPGKKNITTVEISGDVGIVSSNLHDVANSSDRGTPPSFDTSNNITSISHHRQGAHVSNDHLQSSGLSLIQQPNLVASESSSDDSLEDSNFPTEKRIEPLKAKLVDDVQDNLVEVGSSVSANGSSSGDNDTEKTTTSDDNSSDWQSESTNTVIFRGNKTFNKNGELHDNDGGSDFISSLYYPPNPSYLDPEIQINNITVGGADNGDDNGSCVITSTSTLPPSSNNSFSASATSESSQISSSKASPSGTVNVGYKANKVSKVSTDLIIGIKKSSTDKARSATAHAHDSGGAGVNTHQQSTHQLKVGSKRKFDKNNDVSSSSSCSSATDSSEELGKSNETLTDIPEARDSDQQISHHHHHHRIPGDEERDHLEVEMVMHQEKKVVSSGDNPHYLPNNSKSLHQRRESPEGQEQEVPDQSSSEKDGKIAHTEKAAGTTTTTSKGVLSDKANTVPNVKEDKMEERTSCEQGKGKKHGKSSSSKGTISKERILQNALSQIPSRSSPDGADADRSDKDVTPEPEVESPTPTGVVDSFDVTSDEDSWVEEILFEDEDDTSFEEAVKKLPPPLDLTLHTIVEESCEESEAENSGNFYQPSTSGVGTGQKNLSLSQSESNANELEKYFNFGIYNDHSGTKHNSLPHEESEFSDTFSESSFSLQEDDFDNGTEGLMDPAELASTRLEKYFYNLGVPQSMMNPMGMSGTLMNQHHHHNADSDSVGSESDSDNSVLEKRKKVLKHHRRSADFDEEFGDKVSDEEDSFGFGQDGFDTIKKTARKTKKSGSEGSISSENASTSANPIFSGVGGESMENYGNPSAVYENKSPKTLKKSDSESTSKTSSNPSGNDKPVIKVNRSNSFTWSSDEEVNIMMSKLRQLIKNLIKSKADANAAQAGDSTSDAGSSGNSKDKQLVYLENELIRLMKTDNLKNIVEYLSSEESDVDDVYKFIKVVNSSGSTPVDLSDLGDLGDLDIDDPNLLENLQSTMQLQQDGTVPGSPKSSPALLAKVMHHIGNRLNMWMKDEGNLEDDNNDDSVTIKCAPSVSSDLNEDRFSWKGSFESALAAKRQSVGSTDSISSSDYGPDKSMLRSSSLHHLTASQPIEENREEEEPSSSLPRMTNLCNSLPRLNQPNNPAISRAHSLVMTGKNEQPGTESYPISISGPVKSARYRPPGFNPSMKAKRVDTEEKASPTILSQSTPVLTQDPAILRNRSDSMGSIFHDVKPMISVKGQVEFGLQYNYKLACLEVKVVGCRDLAAADTKRNRSDPYVKAYLLPDKSKAGKRKTKTKKNTFSPAFDEVLKFPLTLSDLQNRTLWLSVWHSDMFGKNEFLGEVLVNLKDMVFDDPNPSWWDLQEMSGQVEDMPKGDIVIALKWQPKTDSTGNLSVLVKEAKNLVPVKNGSPSTFVKCALLSERTRKQKTSICRRNFNPIWNQTLLFEDVDDDGVEITIWNHDLLASHDLIGTVRLEYDNPLWESMISRPSFWVEGGLKLS